MARKFRFPNSPYFGWNCEPCEELLVTAGYEESAGYTTPLEKSWQVTFEAGWYGESDSRPYGGIAVSDVDKINSIRKRRQLSTIELRETGVFEYGRSSDASMKAEKRRGFRDELRQPGGLKLIDQALAEQQALPPPHRTLVEMEASHLRDDDSGALTKREKIVRRTAINIPVERVLRMLKLASSADLRTTIVSRIASEDVLDVAEQVDDPELRDALITRALSF